MEKPSKDELIKGLDRIDALVRERLEANPDTATVDALIEIRKVAQDLTNKILILFKPASESSA